MAERFTWVGTVKKVRVGDWHVVGEVPGKVPLVLAEMHARECLCYFPAARRPRVGVRVGVRGPFVVMDVPLEAVSAEDRELLAGGGKPVQHQVDVEDWVAVSADFDPLFD